LQQCGEGFPYTKHVQTETLIMHAIELYGAEVWGVYNIKEVDKLHLRLCKTVFVVKHIFCMIPDIQSNSQSHVSRIVSSKLKSTEYMCS